ncbi:hypothetical protein L917_14407 [Phytophthora nicotianae]|uniref:Uncharacterized protein n=1 Tax=Phytophthora nicotianae TaxID=4792 RepID=W2KM87_PHYNI|nr:hypothetical protein L917_14407 [Phytophthora nicotianae]
MKCADPDCTCADLTTTDPCICGVRVPVEDADIASIIGCG